MITIDLSEITAMISANEIEELIASDLEDFAVDVFNDLTAPPPLGTPRKDGEARNGWKIDTSIRLAPELYNRVVYINALNRGHSKQSPPGFIEAAIDKNLR